MWRESFYAGVCRTPPFVEARQEKHRLKETWKLLHSYITNNYKEKKLPEYTAYAAEMVRYNFTLAVTRNTKKIAANELALLLVLVRLLHNRKHKAASKPERPGIPASACACRQKQLLYRIVYSRRFLFLCWCRIHTKRKTWISAVACVPSKRLLLWWIKYWTNCLYRLTYLKFNFLRLNRATGISPPVIWLLRK